MENEFDPAPYLEYLRRNRDNPGVMADLRCALIPAREHRAWPYIARFFRLDNERERVAAAVTAAAFGCQPECAGETENLGDTMRHLALGSDQKDGLTTFAARFQRLLACDTPAELASQLRGILVAAKANGIPLNHYRLINDLFYWGEKTKRRWADHYYGAERREPAGENDHA